MVKVRVENIIFSSKSEILCRLETCYPFVIKIKFPEAQSRAFIFNPSYRARVNLARAIYSDADIYLLDDPLAAVDSKVATKLYDHCINGFLKNKTRVLITHQVKYLENADNVIFMDKGRTLAEGSFESVRSYNHPFLKNITTEEEDEKVKKVETSKFDPKDGERVQAKNLEIKKEGGIGLKNFWSYIRASNTVSLFIIWVIFKICAVALFILSDVQFSNIGNVAEKVSLFT